MEKAVSEKFNCPVCFEIPEKEIYQCRNGHMVCSGCGENLSQCPQCRVKMDSPKIRSRPLEDLLDMMRFDCANKSLGCTSKLKRYQIQDHVKNCTYAGHTIKLCEKLGFSCEFALDTKSLQKAATHLQTSHDFISRETPHVLISLQDFDRADAGKNSSYLPVVSDMTKENNKLFVLLNLISRVDHTISFACLEISEDSIKDADTEFTTHYSIRANNPLEKPHLTWSRTPTQAKHFAVEINEPMIKFSLSELHRNYIQDGVLEIKCLIQKSIKPQETIPRQTRIVCPLSISKNPTKTNLDRASVNFRSLRLAPSQNEYTPSAPSTSASSENRLLLATADVLFGAGCHECETNPIKKVRFKCVECDNYDLCKSCYLGKHNHHTFVMIQNLDQEKSFMNRWNRALASAPLDRYQVSSYQKLSPDSDSKCSTRECVEKKTHVCLDCPYLVGYCKTCFIGARHKRNHCFAVTDTDTKLCRVARVLLIYGPDPDKTMSRFVSSEFI